MSGPPTQATNSVLNLTNPPLTEIRMDSGGNGIDLNNAPLVNLPVPANPNDAATRDYVDNNAGGAGVGIMNAWPGRVVDIPSGYRLCDGTTIGAIGTGAASEDVEYQQLFEIIKFMLPNVGTEVWGVNTVALPNMQGRVPVGLDPTVTVNQDANAATLGSTNGDYEITLTTNEMPAHIHTGVTNMDGNHTHPGSSTGGTGNHTHQTVASATHTHTGTASASGSCNTVEFNGGGVFVSNCNHTHNVSIGAPSGTTAISGGGHTHTISIVTDGDHTHTLTINMTGSGNAHYNMQPYLVVNWIIRYK